jgi:serine/threonine-protein kinase haspin
MHRQGLHTNAQYVSAGPVSTAPCFLQARRMTVVRGRYSPILQRAWDAYNVKHKSENDSPADLPTSQLYLIITTNNGGQALEDFKIPSFSAAQSLLLQTVLSLAVAEECLEFEHRDLHWGNILVRKRTKSDKPILFKLLGREYSVPHCGVEVCIIDFTLARFRHRDGFCGCLQLDGPSNSWLFEQEAAELHDHVRACTND